MGIRIISVTADYSPDELTLMNLASNPEESNVIRVRRTSDLPSILNDVVEAACTGM